jgi:protoporphyrinogen/coproporphyrinogen III oxidase
VPTDRQALRQADVVSNFGAMRTLRDLVALRPIVRRGATARALSGQEDPSVAEVFGPRLGEEVLRTLIDPLLGGINASDVTFLSLAACAPQLLQRIEGQRSVMHALRAEPATFMPGIARPPFIGLRNGMGSLAAALEDALRAASVDVRLNSEVLAIDRDGAGKWKLTSAAGTYIFDAVLAATPAFVTAKLLETVLPPLSRELASIPYASVVTACYSFDANAVPESVTERLRVVVPDAGTSDQPLVGSGVLVPRDGKRLLTAVTFTSSKWPRSSAPGQVVVRAFAGRHSDDRAIRLDEQELGATLLADLSETLGISAVPTDSLVKRWENALPQYVTGHLARIRRIGDQLSGEPTFGLAGAAFHGIGIPACISNAETAAARLLTSLST